MRSDLKKWIIWGTLCGPLLFSSLAFSKDDTIVPGTPMGAKNVNVQFSHNTGTAFVPDLHYSLPPAFLSHTNLNAKIENKNRLFSVSDGTTQLSVLEVMDWVKNFDVLNIKNVTFDWKGPEFKGEFKELDSKIIESKVHINEGKIACGKFGQSAQLSDNFLKYLADSCIAFGEIRFPFIYFETKTHRATDSVLEPESLYADLASLIDSSVLSDEKKKVDTIENLFFSANNGNVEFEMSIKKIFRMNISSHAQIEWQPSTSEYKVLINDFYVGKIPSKRILFYLLSRAKISNVRINEPFIFYKWTLD